MEIKTSEKTLTDLGGYDALCSMRVGKIPQETLLSIIDDSGKRLTANEE